MKNALIKTHRSLFHLAWPSLLAVLCMTAVSAQAASYVVTRTDDRDNAPCTTGDCSLREAIKAANATPDADTITFDPAVFASAQTIALTASTQFTHLMNTGTLTIIGPGADLLTVAGNYSSRIFYNNNGTLTVVGLTITQGRGIAGAYGASGGGIVTAGGPLTVTACAFVDNAAPYGGAIDARSDTTITNSTFFSNTSNSDSAGGGVIINSATLSVTNCTFSGNTSYNTGGVIYAYGGTTTLTNCTLTKNSARYGGAIFQSGAVALKNTIISGNSASTGPDCFGEVNSLGNVVISNLNGATVDGDTSTLIVADAKLAPLGYYGGPLMTIPLLSGSPAINPASSNSAPANDARGAYRTGTADIGAFEANGVTSTGGAFVVQLPGGRQGTAYSFQITSNAGSNHYSIVGGALPPGMTLSDFGVLSGTPNSGGSFNFAVGISDGFFTATINYALNIVTTSPTTLIVSRTDDDGTNITGANLRQALAYAQTLSGPQTITFAPALAGQTITLTGGATGASDSSALVIAGNITIQGPSSFGVTIAIASGNTRRHFYVNTNARLALQNLTLTGGNVSDYGGAVWNFGAFTARGCTFTGNRAGQGGAIQCWADSTAFSLENCTVAGNTADFGGAINAGALTNTLSFVTIADNTTNTAGSSAYTQYQTTVLMRNVILSRNTGTNFNSVNGGTIASGSANNLINAPSAQLYLGTLASNGGPTKTLAPLAGSPAINGGIAITGLTTDQRGLARPVGDAPDIGAVEDSVGNSDPDGDLVGNYQEYLNGSSPLSIDTDGDGFNDATEMFAGSNPNSAGSVPPVNHLERVLGYGAGRGLDLTGNFIYAFAVGNSTAPGQIGNANFTTDSAPGITVTAPNVTENWATPNFGSDSANLALRNVFKSIRWANANNANPELRKVKVDLANLVPGRNYKLQLLFAENGFPHRVFDVFVNGSLLANDFVTADAQGSTVATKNASAIVSQFNASSSVCNIVLDSSSVAPAGNLSQDVILSAATLAEIPTAAVAPSFNPPGGFYESSATVALSTPSAGAIIHYTLDGTAPSATAGAVYTGGGWLDSSVSAATFTVQTELQIWRSLQSLPIDGSQDFANPSGDGVANIAKFAFNLAPNGGDLFKANARILVEGGTSGLPLITRNNQGQLVVQFIRRKASTRPGIVYLVETGEALTALSEQDLSNVNAVSIDNYYERVTYIDPAITDTRFGRVRIVALGTYTNDFSSSSSSYSLLGTATYSNQAITLVENQPNQGGAVTFNGLGTQGLSGFNASFTINTGPTGNTNPADGLSFAVGNLGNGPWGESGPGTNQSLAVGFVTYTGGGAAGIYLIANGNIIASNPTNPFTNGVNVPVQIRYDIYAGVTVTYNGLTIFRNVATPTFSLPARGGFGISARTGGAYERTVIDDIVITRN